MPRKFTQHETLPAVEGEFTELWRRVDQLRTSVQQASKGPATPAVVEGRPGDVLAGTSHMIYIPIQMRIGSNQADTVLWSREFEIDLAEYSQEDQALAMVPQLLHVHVLSWHGSYLDILFWQWGGAGVRRLNADPDSPDPRPIYNQQQIGQVRNWRYSSAGNHVFVWPGTNTTYAYEPGQFAVVNRANPSADRKSLGFPLVPASGTRVRFRLELYRLYGRPTSTCVQAIFMFEWSTMPVYLWDELCSA